MFGIALGDEDLNDHQRLRNDPRLLAAAAKEHGEVFASVSTLNRLELSGHRSGRYRKVRVDAPEVRELLLKTGV